MHSKILMSTSAIAVMMIALAGCAGNNGLSSITTASVPPKPTVDPICVQLAGQIEGMRKNGILAKVDSAAHRKKSLGRSDVKKVNAYILASEQFQARCGKVPIMVAKPAPVTVSGLTPATTQKAITKPVTPVKKP